MEKIKTKVRKWGNSFGIVIPAGVVNKEGIRENSEVSVTIEPEDKMTVGDLMKLSRKLGLSEKLKNINTQKVLDEIDKELWLEE